MFHDLTSSILRVDSAGGGGEGVEVGEVIHV